MHYALIDKTASLSVADMRKMALAINHAGSDFHHAHESKAVKVTVSDPTKIPDEATIIAGFEDTEPGVDGGALALHDEMDGRPYVRVLLGPLRQAGAGVLEPQTGYSILGSLSHEIWETECDAPANKWVLMPNGKFLAYESADPVEATFITDPKTGLMLSNYVYPAYFDGEAKGVRFDAAFTISEPFAMATGGYQIVADGSNMTEIFGDKMPDWRRKMHRRRSAKRKKHWRKGP